jgi:hypothetical protein
MAKDPSTRCHSQQARLLWHATSTHRSRSRNEPRWSCRHPSARLPSRFCSPGLLDASLLDMKSLDAARSPSRAAGFSSVTLQLQAIHTCRSMCLGVPILDPTVTCLVQRSRSSFATERCLATAPRLHLPYRGLSVCYRSGVSMARCVRGAYPFGWIAIAKPDSPTCFTFSTITGSQPFCCSSSAATGPTMPPPTMRTLFAIVW